MFNEEPIECPYCGDLDSEYDDDLQCIVCLNCGATGPTAPSEEQAILLWNERSFNEDD